MEVVEQAVCQSLFEISDSSQPGEARRSAVNCAEQIGLNETERGSVAIAVTELATNVLKHAKAGKIIFEGLTSDGIRGMRVFAIDKGPGIRDVSAALEDGYSTAGTSGSGLGAVRRLCSNFEIYTRLEHGTCVVAEFWPRQDPQRLNRSMQLGVVSIPVRGESVSGDGWIMKSNSHVTHLMVVDGLGHGQSAAEAAREAERVVMESKLGSPGAMLRDCHDALKKTRGAAAAIATIDREKNTLAFAGMGNISAVLATSEGTRGIASHNGTVGHQMARVQEFTLPWSKDSVLIMHSDGLGSRWNLNDYPGILNKDPALLAAVLYRDFARLRDDVTVLVARGC